VAVIPYLSSLHITFDISVDIKCDIFKPFDKLRRRCHPPASRKGTSADKVKIDGVIEMDVYFH